MVTMNRQAIARDYPELIVAAEAPVLDTSCACLLRLASTVHDEGYKVVLTGEGADEGLAGYFWFKSQMLRERFVRPWGKWAGNLVRNGMLAMLSGGYKHLTPQHATHGVRTGQQDMYEYVAQTREVFFTERLWEQLDGHCAYDDLDLTNERMPRWHPLNQSLYMGYRVHLPGLLLSAKGDRIAMHSSVETRYPFLDDDVIKLCASLDPQYKLRGMKDKWLLRQVAARRLPAPIANRKKTMFRATLSNTFVGANHPEWVDQLLSRESLEATGLFDYQRVAAARATVVKPHITLNRGMLDMGMMLVIATQLWHHTFCGGGLTDLPTWTAPELSEVDEPLPATA
jgi:asparagine synthase (glutamine-hydrolysing)